MPEVFLKFDYLEKPNEVTLKESLETLNLLGALSENENITELGLIMAMVILRGWEWK